MPKVISAKNIGKHQTYDIELASEDHQFFLENGLLTSNSHSDCYTVMTMQSAFLATYHPLEFYAAVMTVGQVSEMQEYVGDIKRKGIKILPVDVNKSKESHTVEGDAIRLSFSAVLGVGPSAIEKIVANQPYEDFNDFLYRSDVGKGAIRPLIFVNAFADMGLTVKCAEKRYELFLSDPKNKNKSMRAKYVNEAEKINVDDYQLHEIVFFENEFMGFSLRGSPFEILDRDKKILETLGSVPDYKEFLESEDLIGILPVYVKDFKERPQRNGKMFAFMKFGTMTGDEFEVPCFATMWKHIKPKAKKGCVYIATFNRRADDPGSLILGKPGFAHSEYSCAQDFINVDDELEA